MRYPAPRRWRADDLPLGFAINYNCRRQASLSPNELDLLLGDYVRIDGFAQWQLHKRLRLGLNLENLGNADYIQGRQSTAFSLTPAAPLTVRCELTITS